MITGLSNQICCQINYLWLPVYADRIILEGAVASVDKPKCLIAWLARVLAAALLYRCFDERLRNSLYALTGSKPVPVCADGYQRVVLFTSQRSLLCGI